MTELDRTRTIHFFDLEKAEEFVADLRSEGNVSQVSISEKSKHDVDYFIVKVKETFVKESDFMAQFKD